ncbi:hypothetical protein F7U82_25110 [Vibrio parahaemolyticus]|nr:hypothetical protein [Vibrio parahaemolyticus]EIO5874634.1 hypothetical protein [Vibrio parahaemolyticus]ELA7521459.1 hypothetical protein [Vibrio parahaemolyticus]ELA8151869.1 hypothetical protein [Vibrio parahaemolyticus]ELC0683591.1 hypothetical protein [Vibrio parahaemolyticus]
MNVVDEVKKIDIDTATGVTLFFVSALAPGLLMMFLYKRNLFIELETLKLVLVSLALGAPGIVLPQFVSTISASVCTLKFKLDRSMLGSAKEWFYRHSINNAINVYLILFICYIFKLSFQFFAWMYVGSIVLLSIYEMIYILKRAADPDKYPSMPVE